MVHDHVAGMIHKPTRDVNWFFESSKGYISHPLGRGSSYQCMIAQKERPVNIILFMIYINFIYNYSNSARIPLAVQVDEGRALGNPTFDPDED